MRRSPTVAQALFYWGCWSLCWIVGYTLLRTRTWGLEKVPRTGPFLWLSNHVTFVDPFFVGTPMARWIFFMASAHWFRIPFVGGALRLYRSFPKAKFAKDPDAMRRLTDCYDIGGAVCIFPEGRRSWDGRTQKVLPNIGRLIKRMNARVVFTRILTGHLFYPRWAVWPRFAPFHVEYDAPVTFPEHMTAEEIEAQVQRAITIDVSRIQAPRFSFGFRMAEGLPNLLWACPHCFTHEALRVPREDRNRVRCSSCGAAWRVDVSQNLRAVEGPARDTTVMEASDSITARFGKPPVADPAAFEARNVVLEDPDGSVQEVFSRQSLGTGPVVLTPDGLKVGPWEIRLLDIVAVSIENRGVLQVRTAQGLLQVDLKGRSVCRWQHFINGWREKLTGKELPSG